MKHIFSTTAVLALIAAPAFAQINADVDAGAGADAQMSVDVDTDVNADAETTLDTGVEAQSDGSFAAGMTLTSDALIGAEIHDPNGEVVGTVANLIIDADGRVAQIVAEIGGFLGLGAREVALERSQFDIEAETEADVRILLAVTLEELEAMPEYEG
ncbi:MAG: PRC-barrel domain-containing protein [Pararhodobacter sp.]|nr:PRC-barrel domain-containing protein [Pararhodobacter sp.]